MGFHQLTRVGSLKETWASSALSGFTGGHHWCMWSQADFTDFNYQSSFSENSISNTYSQILFFSWHLWMTYDQERLTEQHLPYSLFYSNTKILAAPCSCFSHKKLHPVVKAANLTPSFFGIRAAVHISTVIIQNDVACYCISVTTAAK